jgi:hypothetical protein
MIAAKPIVAVYGRTAEGLLAARVDNLAWLAMPVSDGVKIASGWRLTKPMSDWTAMDFHGADGVVADEHAFRAHVETIAAHRNQLAAMGREPLDPHADTPWGVAQTSVAYADGIVCHSTASHGGFHIDEERRAGMPAALRNVDGWYEEDAEWAKVATAFPALFTDYEREHAERTLRDWNPGAWEAVYGRMLDPAESFVRDRQHFEAAHARHWVVIAAVRSRDHSGQVECIATRGGDRRAKERRCFLVPADDYRVGRHGFVIDESRHIER